MAVVDAATVEERFELDTPDCGKRNRGGLEDDSTSGLLFGEDRV